MFGVFALGKIGGDRRQGYRFFPFCGGRKPGEN